MPSLSEILYDFSNLSNLKKAKQKVEFLDSLKQAYASTKRPPSQFVLPPTATGIGSVGAELIGEFLQQHPRFRLIKLPAAHFYNPKVQSTPQKKQAAQAAFDQFIAGLVATKEAGKLTELDLSNSKYPIEWLVRLASDVIHGHPSLRVLKLNTTFITDEMLSAIRPHLNSHVLQVLSLRGNELSGQDFAALVDQFKTHCPQLTLLDLTTNPITEPTAPLIDWLDANPNLSISYPKDRLLQEKSLSNHINHYMPNRVAIAMHDFSRLVSQVDAYKDTMDDLQASGDLATQLSQLEERVNVHQEQVKQDLFAQTLAQEVERRAQQEQWQGQQTVNERLLQQITVQQEKVDSAVVTVQEAHEQVSMVRQEVAVMSLRVGTVEEDNGTLQASLIEVQGTLEAHEDQLEELGESMETVQEEVQGLLSVIDTLTQKVNELPESLSQIEAVHLAGLSEEQQAYVILFKQQLVRMHLAAMVVSTGLVEMHASTKVGKTGKLLDKLSGCAPLGSGIVFNVISGCLDAIDERLMNQRIERLVDLAVTSEEMARRAEQIAMKLVQCLVYQSPIKADQEDSVLRKLIASSKAVGEAHLFGNIDDVMMTMIEEGTEHTLDALMPEEALSAYETRAERDSKLLLTLIMTKGIGQDNPSAIDAQLFLYAAPLITIADCVFMLALTKFCQEQSTDDQALSPTNVQVNPKKRHHVVKLLAASWRNHPEALADILPEKERRTQLLQDTSEQCHQQSLFYFKEPNKAMTLFRASQKPHVSVNNDVATEEIIGHITQTAIGLSNH